MLFTHTRHQMSTITPSILNQSRVLLYNFTIVPSQRTLQRRHSEKTEQPQQSRKETPHASKIKVSRLSCQLYKLVIKMSALTQQR